jgi:hypothetical protein
MRVKVVFPKSKKKWVAKPILEDKMYTHVFEMMVAVVDRKVHGPKSNLSEYRVPDLPSNIATVDRPPKSEVVAAHCSRFSKK